MGVYFVLFMYQGLFVSGDDLSFNLGIAFVIEHILENSMFKNIACLSRARVLQQEEW